LVGYPSRLVDFLISSFSHRLLRLCFFRSWSEQPLCSHQPWFCFCWYFSRTL